MINLKTVELFYTMNKYYFSVICLLLLNATSMVVSAQAINYKNCVEVLHNNIEQHFKATKTGLYYETTESVQKDNPHSWLWPLCALVQAANEAETLLPGTTYMEPVVKAIDQYYSQKIPPAYQDYVTSERISSRFYDDNQWIAIAYMDAYNRKSNPKYLKASKEIYDFMITGLDTIAGGGFYWKEGELNSKNTCSNGPGILVALQLYKITNDKQYLKTALAVYKWTNKNLQAPNGLFYDAIKIPSLKIDKTLYTYNAGSMLQANALLYTITQDKMYLSEAQRIAKAAKAHFFKNNRLPPNYWFNAVMLRGYQELYNLDKNKEWIDFFIQDANSIWLERDANNFLKGGQHKLIDQAGMMEIYARLAQIEKSVTFHQR